MKFRVSRSECHLWLWLIPILLVVFWLGAHGLNADALWGDERNSILDAGGGPFPPRTLAQIWDGVSVRNPWHAPGYFMLLSGWGRLVGWQPPALRAMSLLVGVLAVAWTYRLGRDMLSARIGLYAAAVMGVSALFVYFLHELRMYSIFAFLVPFTVWCYWRIVHSPRAPSRWLWLGLLAGAVAMLYIHYFAAMPLFGIGLYHLLFVRKDRRWWQVVGVMALAGLLFLPWFGSLLSGVAQAETFSLGRKNVITIPDTFIRIAYFFGNGIIPLTLVAVLLAIRPRQKGVWQIWFLLLTTLALVIAVNALVRVMTPTRMRYVLGLWPLIGLLAGVGIDRLRRWSWLPTAVLAGWLVIGVWTSRDLSFVANAGADGAGEQWHSFPWQIATTVFRQHTQPGDALMMNVPDGYGHIPMQEDLIPAFYLDGSGVRVGALGSQSTARQNERALQSSLDFVSQSPRVWVAYVPQRRNVVLPEFETRLSETYSLCPAGIVHPEYEFDLYTRSPVCCTPEADLTPLMRFGDGIALDATDPMPEDAGDALTLTMSWSVADTVPPYTYSVALHVLNVDGDLVAQADYGLYDVAFSCQEAQISLASLPQGEYQLYIIVYAWQSGERLPGEIIATGEQGDRLLLGTFNRSSG